MSPDGLVAAAGSRSKREWPGLLAPPPALAWLVLGLSLCATAWVWRQETQAARLIASQRFQAQALRIQSALERRRDDYAHTLQAVAGLFALDGQVSERQWRDYIAALRLDRNYPGLVAIGFIRAVRAPALPAFVRGMRRTSPHFNVWPAGARDWYLPVLLRTSFRNHRDLTGFDMASVPARLTAAREARDSGQMTLTGRLPTLLDGRRDTFFMFYPVYRRDGARGSVAQRRANLIGFIYCPVIMGDFIQSVGPRLTAGVRLRINNGPPLDGPLQGGAAGGSGGAPILTVNIPMGTGNSRWMVRYDGVAADETGADAGRQALIAGFFISALLFLMTWNLARTRVMALALAEKMRWAQQRSEANLRQVMATLPIGVWVADETGRQVSPNAEAARIWSAPPGAPIDSFEIYKAWDLQLGAAFAAEDWPLARALRRGEQVRDEMTDIEAFDGTRKTLLLSAFPLHDAAGHIIGAVQTLQDITKRRRAEVALEASEERFRSIFEQAAVGIALTDEAGRLLRVNDKFSEITGYERDVLEAMRYQDISWPDDLPANLECMRRLLAGEIATLSFEKRYRHRDGQAVWVHMTVSLSRGSLAGGFCRFIAVAQDITERKRVDEALRELTRHLHTVRETERTRIAREIHDDLGGILTAAKYDLSMAGEGQHPHVLGLIDTAIASLRRIINDLRPSILDNLGLWAAIEWEAHAFQERTGIGCAVYMEGAEIEVEPEAATALFRIFQESLTNVVKHAQARSVSVWAGMDAQGIRLIVDDDGRGIDAADLRKKKSYGILGMRERAQMFHGTVQVTRLEQGTRVRIHLPRPG